MPYLKINHDDAKPTFEELDLPDNPRAWNLLIQVRTDRADREGHPMYIDPETGEVFEDLPQSHDNAPQSHDNAPQSHDNAPQILSEPTWCGATYNEWKELYESAASDPDCTELDPDDDLPF